jgi:hypothetical protein
MTKESANSVVSQLPLSTCTITDNVSRTRDKVSSEVMSRNGPRSLAIRGAKGESVDPSPPWKKLLRYQDKIEGME